MKKPLEIILSLIAFPFFLLGYPLAIIRILYYFTIRMMWECSSDVITDILPKPEDDE